jgi:hypothetical protein
MRHRLIIAGGREFEDYDLLEREVRSFLMLDLKISSRNNLEIVSGRARGADALGEKFAHKYRVPIKAFPADWNKHGTAAGPIRNGEMAAYATACIVFHNGTSRGSADMIQQAKKRGLIVKVVQVTY